MEAIVLGDDSAVTFHLYGQLLVIGIVIFTSLMDGQFIFISFLMATRLWAKLIGPDYKERTGAAVII